MNSNGPSLRILVVDDEKISRQTTQQQLRDSGYHAETAENAYEGLSRMESEPWDVVLTDLRMPNMSGLELLREIRSRFPAVDVILMTAYATVGDAVAAMHNGVVDFLTKPFDFRELDARLRKLAEIRETRRELSYLKGALKEVGCTCGLVGQSPGMRKVFERMRLYANSSAPVLITGDTGTGKELVAKAVHHLGARSRGPFVAVACGAIPAELAESEIFGHEKGAFTGALQRRRGSFERANGGVLLLDDIDDLPLQIQAKLLRALQEGRFVRVGGEEEVAVDVRVIATAKVSLSQAVNENRFREDLYYRLCGLEITMPPLRERGDDVLLLAQHFLRTMASEEQSEVKTLSPEVLDVLRKHHWPGNVRELRRVLESCVAVCPDAEIKPRHLPDHLRERSTVSPHFSIYLDEVARVDFNRLVRDFERDIIQWAMEAAGGEQQRAAELLSLPRTTLQSKLGRMHRPSPEAEGVATEVAPAGPDVAESPYGSYPGSRVR